MQSVGKTLIPGGQGKTLIPGGTGGKGSFGTSSGGSGGSTSRFALEPVIRPFESPRILAARARRKALEESTDDSEIVWGQPSSYGSSDGTKEEDRRQFRIISSKTPNPNDPNDKPPVTERVYDEVERQVQVIRVRSNVNNNHYVDVARILSIVFKGPDGVHVRFNCNPPGGEVVG